MITYLTPYYENAGMLREQLLKLADMIEEIREAVEYIVVDDGSPKNTAASVLDCWAKPRGIHGVVDFSLYRIEVDVRWNHIAARNIAVHHAKYDWLFMTDMDHRVPEQTWAQLIRWVDRDELNKSLVYTFERVDAPNMTPYKPHPHTWFMHKSVWDRFGGYDERFSGHYGMDFLARERLQAFTSMHPLQLPVVRYPREVIADASTTCYERKSDEDREFVRNLRNQLKRDGTYNNPKTLTFPYHRIYP